MPSCLKCKKYNLKKIYEHNVDNPHFPVGSLILTFRYFDNEHIESLDSNMVRDACSYYNQILTSWIEDMVKPYMDVKKRDGVFNYEIVMKPYE